MKNYALLFITVFGISNLHGSAAPNQGFITYEDLTEIQKHHAIQIAHYVGRRELHTNPEILKNKSLGYLKRYISGYRVSEEDGHILLTFFQSQNSFNLLEQNRSDQPTEQEIDDAFDRREEELIKWVFAHKK
jgi:hypothetical protein